MKNKGLIRKSKVICNNDKKYVYKSRIKSKEKTFEYLKSKGFVNYLTYERETEKYEIYPFIKEEEIPPEDKAQELIYLLSLLHIKTTTHQEKNIKETQELYEDSKTKIHELRKFYYELQDITETKVFMSPEEQLLMNNISNFYKALNYAEHKLEEWYKLKKQEKTERLTQLHNNISLNHFLISKENKVIIDWEQASKGIVIYDFLKFYQNEFNNIEMISLFKLYQSKYQYTKSEQLLFEALLAVPPKVEFNKTHILNTINTRLAVNYVNKTSQFLSEYNKENQESNE